MKKKSLAMYFYFLGILPVILFLGGMGCGGGSGGGGGGGGGGNTFSLSVAVLGLGNGSVTSDSGGINCEKNGGTCSADFPSGTTVTLSAAAVPGSGFSGWSGGGCSGKGSCVITVNATTDVQANFSRKIAFQSFRALDGSDAANTTLNIWVVNSDGTDATPLTQLTANAAISGSPQWSPDGTKIVFHSVRALDGSNAPNTNNTFNVWVMNSDGTHAIPLTQLTASGVQCTSPQWSPDGTKIVFQCNRALNGSDALNTNGTYNIWVMNSDGSNPTAFTQLTANAAGSTEAQWSPDGTKIAYSSGRALNGSDNAANVGGVSNIWVMDSDGNNAAHLTSFTSTGVINQNPQWSPDGTQIVYDADMAFDGSDAQNPPNSTENIWVMNSDGTGATPLTVATADKANSNAPQWSPDGAQVAFQSGKALDGRDAANTNDTKNIWLVEIGADPLTLLTADGADSFSPQWSPDGSEIAYESGRALDGSDASIPNITNIWVMNADGTAAVPLTQLTAHGAFSSGAQWSKN